MIEKRWSVLQDNQALGTFCIVCKETNEVLAYNIKNLNSIEKILGWSSLTPEAQTFLLDSRGTA